MSTTSTKVPASDTEEAAAPAQSASTEEQPQPSVAAVETPDVVKIHPEKAVATSDSIEHAAEITADAKASAATTDAEMINNAGAISTSDLNHKTSTGSPTEATSEPTEPSVPVSVDQAEMDYIEQPVQPQTHHKYMAEEIIPNAPQATHEDQVEPLNVDSEQLLSDSASSGEVNGDPSVIVEATELDHVEALHVDNEQLLSDSTSSGEVNGDPSVVVEATADLDHVEALNVDSEQLLSDSASSGEAIPIVAEPIASPSPAVADDDDDKVDPHTLSSIPPEAIDPPSSPPSATDFSEAELQTVEHDFVPSSSPLAVTEIEEPTLRRSLSPLAADIDGAAAQPPIDPVLMSSPVVADVQETTIEADPPAPIETPAPKRTIIVDYELSDDDDDEIEADAETTTSAAVESVEPTQPSDQIMDVENATPLTSDTPIDSVPTEPQECDHDQTLPPATDLVMDVDNAETQLESATDAQPQQICEPDQSSAPAPPAATDMDVDTSVGSLTPFDSDVANRTPPTSQEDMDIESEEPLSGTLELQHDDDDHRSQSAAVGEPEAIAASDNVNIVKTVTDDADEANDVDVEDDADEEDEDDDEDDDETDPAVSHSAPRFSGKQMPGAMAAAMGVSAADEPDDDYDDSSSSSSSSDDDNESSTAQPPIQSSQSTDDLAVDSADLNRVPQPAALFDDTTSDSNASAGSSGSQPPPMVIVAQDTDAELTLSVPHSPDPDAAMAPAAAATVSHIEPPQPPALPQQLQLTPNASSDGQDQKPDDDRAAVATAAASSAIPSSSTITTPPPEPAEHPLAANAALNGSNNEDEDVDIDSDTPQRQHESAAAASGSPASAHLPGLARAQPAAFMSPSSFRSTDEMRYYLKNHLQYSDLGRLFGRPGEQTAPGAAAASGEGADSGTSVASASVASSGSHMGDYAEYLGLQRAVRIKCFKCRGQEYGSLEELKVHQVRCLREHAKTKPAVEAEAQVQNNNEEQQPPQNQVQQNQQQPARQRSLALRRPPSMHSCDNAMDVDQARAIANGQANQQQQQPQNHHRPARQLVQRRAGSSTASAPSTAAAQALLGQALDQARIRITRRVYLCSACGTYYENWNLFHHMSEVHRKFMCLLCLGIFNSGERLLHHLESKHEMRPDVFEHREELLERVGDQCYLMCTVCEHVFGEREDFTAHSCEEFIRACRQCGLKFVHRPQCKEAVGNGEEGQDGGGGRTSRRERGGGRRHRRRQAEAAAAAAAIEAAPVNASVEAPVQNNIVPNQNQQQQPNVLEPIASGSQQQQSQPEPTSNNRLNFSSMFASSSSTNNTSNLATPTVQSNGLPTASTDFRALELPQNLLHSAPDPSPAASVVPQREPSLFGLLNAAAAAPNPPSLQVPSVPPTTAGASRPWTMSDSIFSHPAMQQQQQQQHQPMRPLPPLTLLQQPPPQTLPSQPPPQQQHTPTTAASVGKNMQNMQRQQQHQQHEPQANAASDFPPADPRDDMEIINSYINNDYQPFGSASHPPPATSTTQPIHNQSLISNPPQQQLPINNTAAVPSAGKSIGFANNNHQQPAGSVAESTSSSSGRSASVAPSLSSLPMTIQKPTAAKSAGKNMQKYARASPAPSVAAPPSVEAAAPSVADPPPPQQLLVPKLKLKLGKNFQHTAKIESDDDEDEDEEEEEEEESENSNSDDSDAEEDEKEVAADVPVNGSQANANTADSAPMPVAAAPETFPFPQPPPASAATTAASLPVAVSAITPFMHQFASSLPLPMSPLGSFAASLAAGSVCGAQTPAHLNRSIAADSDQMVDVELTSEAGANEEHEEAMQQQQRFEEQHQHQQQQQQQQQQHHTVQMQRPQADGEDEDVNIEDEDRDSSMEIEPASGLAPHPPRSSDDATVDQVMPTTEEASASVYPTFDEPAPAPPQPPQSTFVTPEGLHLASADDTPVLQLQLEATANSSALLVDLPIRDLLRRCIWAAQPQCLYCNHARRIAVNGHQLARHMLAQHRFEAPSFAVNSEPNDEDIPISTTDTIIQLLLDALPSLRARHFNADTYDDAPAEAANNQLQSRRFECLQCRFPARHHKDLYLHNRKVHAKTPAVLCLMCRQNYYSHSELTGHICPGAPADVIINQTTSTAEEAAAPEASAIPHILFRCPLCPADRIASGFRLMVHLRKRHSACDVCLDVCQDQGRLSAHVCKHKLNHLCYRCGISYRNKADITKHLFWKHGTESQQCKRCMQKKWPHVYHFCVPPATFGCDVCGVQFRKAVALRVHRRLHADAQPYECTEDGCEKRFISRKLLLKHVARHNAPEEPEEEEVQVEVQAKETAKTKTETANQSASDAQTKDEKNAPITAADPAKPATPPPPAPKPLIDLIDALRAPNLSESDSSDESEDERKKPDTGKQSSTSATEAKPDSQKEQPAATGASDASDAHVANIWENFKSYQASQNKSTADTAAAAGSLAGGAADDRLLTAAAQSAGPSVFHVSQSDHDYCAMYRKPDVVAPAAVQIKLEPVDEEEQQLQLQQTKDAQLMAALHTAANPTADPLPQRPKSANKAAAAGTSTKSPKKGQSPKKTLAGSDDSSDDSSSGSDSDSSCSCGSNCSCSSGSSSDSDSSSSSSSSSGDAAAAKTKSKDKKQQQPVVTATAKKPATPVPSKPGGVMASATAPIMSPQSQQGDEDDRATVSSDRADSKASPKPATAALLPPLPPPAAAQRPAKPDPDALIFESDLETDESDTDEDFYDEHPQRLAAALLAKRQQLLAATAAGVAGTFDIVENSRPSTPSLPPAEDGAAAAAEGNGAMSEVFRSPQQTGGGASVGASGSLCKSASRRLKLKKRKRDRKNAAAAAIGGGADAEQTVPALRLNFGAAMAASMDAPPVVPSPAVASFVPPPQPVLQTPPVPPNPYMQLHQDTSTSQLPRHLFADASSPAAIIGGHLQSTQMFGIAARNLQPPPQPPQPRTPITTPSSAYASLPAPAAVSSAPPSRHRTASATSCSDADTVASSVASAAAAASTSATPLKRSKRRRIPNKFYGYTSDEDNMSTTSAAAASSAHNSSLAAGGGGLASLAHSLAFAPQPPPQLTWCKEDLPQKPTPVQPVVHHHQPPLKTVIKLPPQSTPASAQPPIPPLIIRPNRDSFQLKPQSDSDSDAPDVVGGSNDQFSSVHLYMPSTPVATTMAQQPSTPHTPMAFGLAATNVSTPLAHTPLQQMNNSSTLNGSLQTTPAAPRVRQSLGSAPNSRKRASKASTAAASKAKRQARNNLPRTPAIPARFQTAASPVQHLASPAVPPPQPAAAAAPAQLQPFQRPATSQLVTSQQHQQPALSQPSMILTPNALTAGVAANQIRYPIQPPAGCRPAQPGESVYCYCRCPYDEVSEMIACDGQACPIEWFHFECVNIMVPPKGMWYCPQCRPKYAHVLAQQQEQAEREAAYQQQMQMQQQQ